jgi:hypothetical protein
MQFRCGVSAQVTWKGALRVLARRWYITFLGLLLTIGFCLTATHVVKTTYEARAVVLLLPPKYGSATNPYLNLASLNGLSDVVDSAIAAELQGIGIEFSMESDQSATGGPLIRVTGQGATPAMARHAARYVVSLIPTTLRRLQGAAEVQAGAYITSLVLHPADRADANRKSQIRALIVAVAAGMLLTTLLTLVVDRRMTSRGARRGSAGDRTGVRSEDLASADAGAARAPAVNGRARGSHHAGRRRDRARAREPLATSDADLVRPPADLPPRKPLADSSQVTGT